MRALGQQLGQDRPALEQAFIEEGDYSEQLPTAWLLRKTQNPTQLPFRGCTATQNPPPSLNYE